MRARTMFLLLSLFCMFFSAVSFGQDNRITELKNELLSTQSSIRNTVTTREINGFKFLEETITTTIPYLTGFFSKEEKQIQISGVLRTPYGNHPIPYPLMIYSHGSQDGGVQAISDGLPPIIQIFLARGYATYSPIRKGFNRKGMPPSELNADRSEPIACNNYSYSEEGLQSAMADTKALYNMLTKKAEIDLTNVTLMGHSRGGFLSLALAADGLPGVVKVLNFSGGWLSERCYSSFNSGKFEEFSKKIKVPILSFYGDNDRYYSIQNIRYNLRLLEKGGMSSGYILPDGNHSLLFRNLEFWVPLVFPK